MKSFLKPEVKAYLLQPLQGHDLAEGDLLIRGCQEFLLLSRAKGEVEHLRFPRPRVELPRLHQLHLKVSLGRFFRYLGQG